MRTAMWTWVSVLFVTGMLVLPTATHGQQVKIELNKQCRISDATVAGMPMEVVGARIGQPIVDHLGIVSFPVFELTHPGLPPSRPAPSRCCTSYCLPCECPQTYTARSLDDLLHGAWAKITPLPAATLKNATIILESFTVYSIDTIKSSSGYGFQMSVIGETEYKK